jgi:dTMP kinase
MPRKGSFIVLEGPDKSGKSTQAALLVQALRAMGLSVVHTREPGGTSFAEAVRSVLLDPRQTVCPLAELLLYEAARAQHTEEVIRPALARGEVVLSERYTLATLAYQAGGRGLPVRLVRGLNRTATGGLRPDLTLVLDIPDSEFGVRDPSRRHDRLEKESSAFRRKVRRAYRRLAKTEPRTFVIDSRREKPVVHADILKRVLEAIC